MAVSERRYLTMGKDFREQKARKSYTFPGPGLRAYGVDLTNAQKGTFVLQTKKWAKGSSRRRGLRIVFCPKCRLSSNVRSVRGHLVYLFECWRCKLEWLISTKDLRKFKKPEARSETPLVANLPRRKGCFSKP